MESEKIIEIVDAFIENSLYQYAIMINGDWGSGKTYFIKHDLIPHIRKKYQDGIDNKGKRDLNYISLYGIKETSDISDVLCSQAIEDKIEKIGNGKKIQKILKKQKPIDTSTKPFRFITLATNAFAKMLIKKAELGDEKDIKSLMGLFPDFDNNIIIFDDLERCSCDINDVLGFINNYVEHSQAKIIIVANEKEIGKSYSDKTYELQTLIAMNEHLTIDVETAEEKDTKLLQGKNYKPDESHFTPQKLKLRRDVLFGGSEKYKRIKEKVIGKTIVYEPDLKTVFQNLIDQHINNPELKKALSHEIDNLITYAIKDNHKNIRTFLFFLEKIDKIFSAIDNKYQPLHFGIVDYCYRSSIRMMAGKKIHTEWKDEEYGMQSFGESELTADYLFGYRFIDVFIHDGYINKEDVNQVLERYERKVIEEGKLANDPYQRIKEWYCYDDEEVEQWIVKIIENVENDLYSFVLYPELIHNLSQIYAYDVFTDLIDKAFRTIEDHLREMDPDNIIILPYERFIIEEDTKEIYWTHMEVIKRIIEEKNNDSRKNEYQRIINEENPGWVNEIIDILRRENSIKGWSCIYWISPEIIIERLKNSTNKELNDFRYLLDFIYHRSFYEKRKDDYAHLLELKNNIKLLATSACGQIKKQEYKWLERDIEEYLRSYSQYQPDNTIKI